MNPKEGYVFLEVKKLLDLLNPNQIPSGKEVAGIAFKPLQNGDELGQTAEISAHTIFKDINNRRGYKYISGVEFDYIPCNGRQFSSPNPDREPLREVQFQFQTDMRRLYRGHPFCFSYISRERLEPFLKNLSESEIILKGGLIDCSQINCRRRIRGSVFTLALESTQGENPLGGGQLAPCPPFWDPRDIPSIEKLVLNQEFKELLIEWANIGKLLRKLSKSPFCSMTLHSPC